MPEGEFAYGRPDRKDQEGAKEITSSWDYPQQSKTSAASKDFKTLNKIGISKGAINAKEQAKLRKEKDIRISQEPKHKPEAKSIPKDMAFGVLNRPSTPIQAVISHSYGTYAEEEIQQKLKAAEKPVSKTKEIKPTKASTLLQQKKKNTEVKNEKLEGFKIKKFTKVESRVKAQIDKDKKKFDEEHKS